MFYKLPPVGNRIITSPARVHEAGHKLPEFLLGHKAKFYASGTAALASAITAAIKLKSKQLQDRPPAEVILPAYACPDLVSAICFTGAIPVLVDIEYQRPWLDLAKLSDAITENTVALVGVNLFGISERWQQIRELTSQHDIILIEDSAQYFPAAEDVEGWQGDLVVFSFGRGKPVSLLGGGAVFVNRPNLYDFLPKADVSPVSWKQRVLYSLKARLYNVMISPWLYWLPQSLPFLHLGETRYQPLSAIELIDRQRMDLLVTNIYYYQTDEAAQIRIEKMSAMLQAVNSVVRDGIIDLPQCCEINDNRRLLRYPLLLPTTMRDRVYREMLQAGLGASVMYPVSLPKISGVVDVLDNSKIYANAEMFASQILTLPLHAQLSDKDIEKMKVILNG